MPLGRASSALSFQKHHSNLPLKTFNYEAWCDKCQVYIMRPCLKGRRKKKNFIYVYVPVCGYVHISAGVRFSGAGITVDLWTSWHACWETELRSTVRVVCAFIHWANSPVPGFSLTTKPYIYLCVYEHFMCYMCIWKWNDNLRSQFPFHHVGPEDQTLDWTRVIRLWRQCPFWEPPCLVILGLLSAGIKGLYHHYPTVYRSFMIAPWGE